MRTVHNQLDGPLPKPQKSSNFSATPLLTCDFTPVDEVVVVTNDCHRWDNNDITLFDDSFDRRESVNAAVPNLDCEFF